MAVEQTKTTTIEEFERFLALPENANRLFELIDGEIIEKMPTEEHGVIASNLHGHLWVYNRQHDLGRLSIESQHRMPQDNQNARLLDVAFTTKDRALPLTTQGAVPQMPDLVVEIQSPNDTLKKLRDKATYYLANESRLVWLVLTEKQLVEVYRSDGEVDILNENDALDGGEVLPGFRLPVQEIFAE